MQIEHSIKFKYWNENKAKSQHQLPLSFNQKASWLATLESHQQSQYLPSIFIVVLATTSTTFWRIKDLMQLSISKFFSFFLPFVLSFSKWYAFYIHFRLCLPCFTAARKSFFFRLLFISKKVAIGKSYEYALGSFAQRLSKYRLGSASTSTRIMVNDWLKSIVTILLFLCVATDAVAARVFSLFVLFLLLLLLIIIGCWAPRVLGSALLLLLRLLKTYTATKFNFYDFYDYVLWLYFFPISHRSSSNSSSLLSLSLLVALDCASVCACSHSHGLVSLFFRNNIHCRSGRTLANYYSFPILCTHIC